MVEQTPIVQRIDFPFLEGWEFDGINPKTLADPAVRAGIPDLKTCLEVWYETGNFDLLRFRVDVMSRSHLAPVFLMNAYGYLNTEKQADGSAKPFMIINHEPSFSARENSEILAEQREEICQTLGTPEVPEVLKTVTLRFERGRKFQTVLISGIGDFHVNPGVKRNIGRELGLSGHASKLGTLNSRWFDTTVYLGLQPGMVKPILERHLVGNVDGICYLKGRVSPEDFVAISVSHIDSIIMQARDFEFLFADYAHDFYGDFGFTKRAEYDFYKNNRTR